MKASASTLLDPPGLLGASSFLGDTAAANEASGFSSEMAAPPAAANAEGATASTLLDPSGFLGETAAANEASRFSVETSAPP